MPMARLVPLYDQERYAEVLGKVAPYFKDADYSIVNLECPVVEGEGTPIVKQGPNLKCSSKAVAALKYMGCKCATLANNHFRDYGDEGCVNTIAKLNDAGIDHLGGGENLQEAQRVLYKETQGVNVAFVNFCEHEFSIAENCHAGAAPLDLVENYRQIIEACNNADYVIVIVHGGHEHYQLPSPRMKKTYRWFTEIGADAVINHHQHCYSGYEVYNGKPIFYGLGNFCFDGNRSGKDIWYEGYMVELTVESQESGVKSLGYKLIPYIQCKEEPAVIPMTGDDEKNFFNNIERLNAIIQDDAQLSAEFDKWCKHRAPVYTKVLAPLSNNRWVEALRRRGFFRWSLSEKKRLYLTNLIECESHYDVFKEYLKNEHHA